MTLALRPYMRNGACGTKTVEVSIDVAAPASTAYDAWLQFELFPCFVADVEELCPEDRHLHGRAERRGETEEWDTTGITEQIPDQQVAWRSESGSTTGGVVTFHRLSEDRSRVTVQLGYEPTQLGGDVIWGVLKRGVERDLQEFRRFVEARGDHAEGWRGELEAG